jgi:CDP-paratose 2-epimerase
LRILITGICGYVGSRLASFLLSSAAGIEVLGIDNLSRPGSETALQSLRKNGVQIWRGDIRLASDVQALPDVDWVVDCAANPTVTAGLSDGGWGSSRQLVEHNLAGTLNILEFCKGRGAGLVLLSTSRVYSVAELNALPLREGETRFILADTEDIPGCSNYGISEDFSTAAPVSLYGATKLASERIALEYGDAFGFPVWINRCGVIGGPGQYGRVDQGILAFWVFSFLLGRPLRYIGFGGTGKQVRDFVQAEDVADLVLRQMMDPSRQVHRVHNVGGGAPGAFSLRELTEICRDFFGSSVSVMPSNEERRYDIPYYVTDTRRVQQAWGWTPSVTGEELVLSVCRWARQHHAFVEVLAAGGGL